MALRNEENNIQRLLNELYAQDYEKENIEFILINDHSGDKTEAIFKTWIEEKNTHNFNWASLDSDKFGKKKAIEKGIEIASGQYYLFTDADCTLKSGWVSSMVLCQQNSNAQMVCAPVVITHRTLMEKCQSIEFSSLIAVSSTSILINKPSLCNAANFLVEAQSVIKSASIRKDGKLASGDDVFLLHALKKLGKKIVFNRNEMSEVSTQAIDNWNLFLAQRLRWASKWKSGMEGSNRWLAIAAMAFHLTFMLGNIFLIFNHNINFFLIAIGLKALAETLFLKPFNTEKSYDKSIGEIWFMQIPYSLYVLYFGIKILISNQYVWKERTYQY